MIRRCTQILTHSGLLLPMLNHYTYYFMNCLASSSPEDGLLPTKILLEKKLWTLEAYIGNKWKYYVILRKIEVDVTSEIQRNMALHDGQQCGGVFLCSQQCLVIFFSCSSFECLQLILAASHWPFISFQLSPTDIIQLTAVGKLFVSGSFFHCSN